MDPLERLLALREIDDLIGRYCMLFDDQKWDAFAELWTDDAAFVVDGVAFEGRDVMLEFLRTCLPEGYQSKHMISPPIVELAARRDAGDRQDRRGLDRPELRERDRGALRRRPGAWA